MKKTFLLIIACCIAAVISAQNVTLNHGGYDGASFTVTLPMPNISTQKIDDKTFAILNLEGSTHLFRYGEPDLPVISQIIEIPLCSDIEITVSDIQTRKLSSADLKGYPIMPMQPVPSKAANGPQPFVMDSVTYTTNAFYGASKVAWVDIIGIARDRRLATIKISPFRFNPVTGDVEVITYMHLIINYVDVDIAATRELHNRFFSPAFSVGNNVISTLPSEKSVRNAAPIHYLIVAHSSFRGALDNFIDWKRRRGMIVTVGYTDETAVGTTSTSIANYIKNFYTNATNTLPPPTYLLIVGDYEQIPAFSSHCTTPSNDHFTDLYYVTWDDDNIPDCYRGRFSAQNLSQLTPQIEKSLLYEGYNFSDPSYLSRGILIAGEDYDDINDNAYKYCDPAMDYVAKTYVNSANGFTNVKYYKNNTNFAPEGVTVTGSSQSSSSETVLRSLYNQGYGWIQYTGHGAETSWSHPLFTTDHVAQMTNNGRPSIFIANCCFSGQFQETNCLGEALLRQGNNAGAVAYIGATATTYWPHDFCWTVGMRNNIHGTMNTSYNPSNPGMYDLLFHTHNENYTIWGNTLGSMIISGNMAVESYGSFQLYYWEIYQLFGDPSIIPWLGQPANMPFNGATVISNETRNYTFTTAPRAYVAITESNNHALVAAAYSDAITGDVSLSIPSDIEPGIYDLSIYAQGYKPFFSEVSVVVNNGPFLSVVSVTPQSGHILPGQINTFDLSVTNNGVTPAIDATFHVQPLSEGTASLLPTADLPSINNGSTINIPSAIKIFVPETYSYNDVVDFQVNMQFANRNSSRIINCRVSAPKLEVTNVTTSDFSPGSHSEVTCRLTNNGDMPTGDLTISLVNLFNMVATEPQPINVGVLQPGQSTNLSYSMVMANNLPDCPIPFNLLVSNNEGTSVLKSLIFNGIGTAIEDFETGNFNNFSWQQGYYPWEITTSEHHSGSYSARSKSNLGNNRSSEFSISWTSSKDDSISFWYIVSSEADYDIFYFYIDDNAVLEASGTDVSTWTRASFPVDQGTHTFKFKYSKDNYTTEGNDCVWIDDITLPYTGTPTRFEYDTVCQGTEYVFAGNHVPTNQIGNFVYSNVSGIESTYLALTVMGEPEVTITKLGNSTENIHVILTAHGADEYLWNTGDTTFFIIVGPEYNDRYSVTGYRGGCSGEASIPITAGLTQENEFDHQLSVSPNPTHDIVDVVCSDAIRASVINLMGQQVADIENTGSHFIFSLQNLPNGIYFLKVETTGGVAVKKIIKE